MMVPVLQAAEAQPLTASETRAMIIASQRYPDLQRAGTPHFEAFQRLLAQSIRTESVVFKDPEWPLRIAEHARESLPALQQGARRVGRTPIERYEDAINSMIESGNPSLRQYGLLEREAHQAELAGDSAKAARIRAELAQLQALGRIEALLNQMSHDIWRVKNRLGIP